MRAVLCKQLGMPDTLVIEDLPSPHPGPDEVAITVQACGLSYADALQVQGRYQIKPPLPFIPAGEVAGIIKAVGANIRDFEPGDAVFGRAKSGCAEEVLAGTARLYPLPQGLDFVTAAAFPNNYSTSFYALRERGRLQSGETVLVLGASGGVGLAAIDIAKMMGARVIACASTPDKLDLCKRMGADETVNYETENVRDAIKRLTGERGVDVVLDPIGDKYAEPAVRGLAWNGRYLVVGFAAGEIPKIALNLPLLKGASIVGVWSGAYQEKFPDKGRALLMELARLIASGKLKPYVADKVPLEGAAGALQSLLTRRALGKIVVVPGARK